MWGWSQAAGHGFVAALTCSLCTLRGLSLCMPSWLLPPLQACHKWWKVLAHSVRQVDVAAADAAGDTSLRVCLAKMPLTDDQLIPNVAAFLIAG